MVKKAMGGDFTSSVESRILRWLSSQPVWVHKCAAALASGQYDAESLPVELMASVEAEVRREQQVRPSTISLALYNLGSAAEPFVLSSVHGVKGINRLSSDARLDLDCPNLVIVYGNNGSGKTGYVRLLKCSAGKLSGRELLPNVFEPPPDLATWEVSYKTATDHVNVVLTPDSISSKVLYDVQVFDEHIAKSYRTDERELSFEPPILGLIQSIIGLADHLRDRFNQLINGRYSALPSLPQKYIGTQAAVVLERISQEKSRQGLASKLAWQEKDDNDLARARQDLESLGSSEVAKRYREQIAALNLTLARGREIESGLALENRTSLLALRKASKEASSAFEAAAQSAASSAVLSGVGSEEWRLLWEAARSYSSKLAYPDHAFPNVSEDATCVLCQQTLDAASRRRMDEFEAFVVSNLGSIARARESELQESVKRLPASAAISTFFDSVRVLLPEEASSDSTELLRECGLDAVQKLHFESLGASDIEGLVNSWDAPLKSILDRLQVAAISCQKSLENITAPEKEAKKLDLQRQIDELECKQWLFSERDAILVEWERLESVRFYRKCIELCSTTEATMFKGRLYEELVSSAVKQKFQDELRGLHFNAISTDFSKSKSQKGRVLHKVGMVNAKRECSNEDVLSEGEQRVVAFAAFLAECEEAGVKSPLIFDDPVNSLDHKYERRIADRLLALCANRQVVVFTHRLAFAKELEDLATRLDVQVHKKYIYQREGITGNVSDSWPLKSSSASAMVNRLLSAQIPLLKRAVADGNLQGEEDLRRQVMATAREAVEMIIEHSLLSGVVTRFAKEIRTTKLMLLSKISLEDCQLLDELMNRYSLEIHAQPDERPYEPPTADQIEADLKRVKAWLEEFEKRDLPTV